MKFINDVVNSIHVYQAEEPVWKAMRLQIGRADWCGGHPAGTTSYEGLHPSYAYRCQGASGCTIRSPRGKRRLITCIFFRLGL